MSKVLNSKFFIEFIDTVDLCCSMGWNECNGGNMSYRIKEEDIALVKDEFTFEKDWIQMQICVPNLANEYFLVTGSGKFFRFTKAHPESSVCIAQVDETGTKYRIVWGLVDGGRPTSEFPTHLLNHSVKKEKTGGKHRLVLHVHAPDVIALTFVLPQDDKAFTRELWDMMPECSVVFPGGIGVVPLMRAGSIEIANATAEKFRTYDVVVWALHGIFCSGENFKDVFGVIETVEKAAGILVKVISMGGKKIRPTAEQIEDLCDAYGKPLNKNLLY